MNLATVNVVYIYSAFLKLLFIYNCFDVLSSCFLAHKKDVVNFTTSFKMITWPDLTMLYFFN